MSDDAGSTDDAKTISNREAWEYFLDGPRDVFTCESCGAEAHRGNPSDMPGALYAEVDDEAAIVCVECNEKYAWETTEARIRARRQGPPQSPVGSLIDRIRTKLRPFSSRIPVPLSVHDVAPGRRASLLPEQSIFAGRLVSVLGLAGALLVGIALFAALTGALFVSPRTGVQWFSITANEFRQWGLNLVARPFLVLGVVGLGYLAHLVEYQRHITDLTRENGRSRPRWHYLLVFSSVGLVGWLLWVLSQFDVLSPGFLPVGVLTWSVGAFVLVYFLHETLLEDRWSYGLQIHSAIWKFPGQFAVGLMLYEGVIGLPGPGSITYTVAIVPPVVGLGYAARRYFAFSKRGATVRRRVQQIRYRWRQVLPWPLNSPSKAARSPPETNQFGQLDGQSGEDRDVAGTSSLDREQELRQTREWASYLESELHDREDQMQELEAKLAQVRQDLREGDESADRARDSLLTDLFDIRDNFRRALDAEALIEDDAAGEFREGIELIDRQIKSTIEREGVEEIDTSGRADPKKHRIVKTVETAEHAQNEIVDVHQLGYCLDDRILREAHVVVAEDPTTAGEDGDEYRDVSPDDTDRSTRGGDSS